jgi:hypothetical protein
LVFELAQLLFVVSHQADTDFFIRLVLGSGTRLDTVLMHLVGDEGQAGPDGDGLYPGRDKRDGQIHGASPAAGAGKASRAMAARLLAWAWVTHAAR